MFSWIRKLFIKIPAPAPVDPPPPAPHSWVDQAKRLDRQCRGKSNVAPLRPSYPKTPAPKNETTSK